MFKPWLKPEVETKPQLDEVGQCLMDAAQRIRDWGWCQNALCKSSGEVCAVGAIKGARLDMESTLGWSNTSLLAVNVLGRLLNLSPFEGVPHWNDAPERTADEVIAALEAAALTRALSLRDGAK